MNLDRAIEQARKDRRRAAEAEDWDRVMTLTYHEQTLIRQRSQTALDKLNTEADAATS